MKYKCYKLKNLNELFDNFKYFEAKFIIIDEG